MSKKNPVDLSIPDVFWAKLSVHFMEGFSKSWTIKLTKKPEDCTWHTDKDVTALMHRNGTIKCTTITSKYFNFLPFNTAKGTQPYSCKVTKGDFVTVAGHSIYFRLSSA